VFDSEVKASQICSYYRRTVKKNKHLNAKKISSMSYQNNSVIKVLAEFDAVMAAITSADFVQDASATVTDFPNILPPPFDKNEYSDSDYTSLLEKLTEFRSRIDLLLKRLKNTYDGVDIGAMTASLEIHVPAPGMKGVEDNLEDRLKRGVDLVFSVSFGQSAETHDRAKENIFVLFPQP
jgi:hypothetical protein